MKAAKAAIGKYPRALRPRKGPRAVTLNRFGRNRWNGVMDGIRKTVSNGQNDIRLLRLTVHLYTANY